MGKVHRPCGVAAMVGGKKVAPQFTAGTLSTEGAYAYAKYRSIDQKIVMPMREAEVVECRRNPGDRASRSAGRDRERRIAADKNRGGQHRFCQLSRQSCAGPTCIWLV